MRPTGPRYAKRSPKSPCQSLYPSNVKLCLPSSVLRSSQRLILMLGRNVVCLCNDSSDCGNLQVESFALSKVMSDQGLSSSPQMCSLPAEALSQTIGSLFGSMWTTRSTALTPRFRKQWENVFMVSSFHPPPTFPSSSNTRQRRKPIL